MVSCSHGKKVIPYDAAVNPDMNLMEFLIKAFMQSDMGYR